MYPTLIEGRPDPVEVLRFAETMTRHADSLSAQLVLADDLLDGLIRDGAPPAEIDLLRAEVRRLSFLVDVALLAEDVAYALVATVADVEYEAA